MAGKKFDFRAEIKKHPSLNSGYIEFPYDVKKEFGKGRVKVKSLINGVNYQGSLVKMGGDCHWLGITQEVRKAIGKNFGDIVHCVIEEDSEERIVDIPDDLMNLFAKEKYLLDYFKSLSYTHRKEYVRWIIEAKKEETRKSRLEKTIEMLRNGKKTPF